MCQNLQQNIAYDKYKEMSLVYWSQIDFEDQLACFPKATKTGRLDPVLENGQIQVRQGAYFIFGMICLPNV